MEPEVVIASSPTDAGISCWDLRTGAEHLRYKSCASAPHGLTSVAGRFLASSQVRDAKSSTSGSILYWSWNKVFIFFEYLLYGAKIIDLWRCFLLCMTHISRFLYWYLLGYWNVVRFCVMRRMSGVNSCKFVASGWSEELPGRSYKADCV